MVLVQAVQRLHDSSSQEVHLLSCTRLLALVLTRSDDRDTIATATAMLKTADAVIV